MGKNFKPPLFAPFGLDGRVQNSGVGLGASGQNVPDEMVMDHPTVTAMANVLALEGIVGLSFFGRTA